MDKLIQDGSMMQTPIGAVLCFVVVIACFLYGCIYYSFLIIYDSVILSILLNKITVYINITKEKGSRLQQVFTSA